MVSRAVVPCPTGTEQKEPTMPLLKQCAYAGCFKLIPDGIRYCAKHAPIARDQELQRKRKGSTERGYNYKWQKESKAFLKRNPLCEECKQRGLVTLAEVVDHIQPHKGDQKLFWNHDNWQALCKRCHDSKTAREDGRWGRYMGHARTCFFG